VSLHKWRLLAAKVGTTNNLPILQPVIFIRFPDCFSSCLSSQRVPYYFMKLNAESRYTNLISKRESCFEFMYFTFRMLFECKYTNFRILCKLTLDEYSEQKISMSNDNTQISSLWVRHDSRTYSSQIFCMGSVKTLLPSLGVSHVCSLYSAQLRCKSFIIIKFHHMSKTIFPVKRLYSLPLNEFHHLWRQMFRAHIQHIQDVGQKKYSFFSRCNSSVSYLFSTATK
jgi:hypothetical protein